MRTTVDLDERLLERAKRLAASNGQTLGALLSTALASYLATRARRTSSPFELIVRGRPGGRAPTAQEIAEIEEDEDRASLRLPRSGRSAAT